MQRVNGEDTISYKVINGGFIPVTENLIFSESSLRYDFGFLHVLSLYASVDNANGEILRSIIKPSIPPRVCHQRDLPESNLHFHSRGNGATLSPGPSSASAFPLSLSLPSASAFPLSLGPASAPSPPQFRPRPLLRLSSRLLPRL